MVRSTRLYKHSLFLLLIGAHIHLSIQLLYIMLSLVSTPVTLRGHCLDILPYCICRVEPQRWFGWDAISYMLTYWGERQMTDKVSLRCIREMAPSISQ
uniref:Putative ovule protein n=2 Tax=Solanum chacoense TaxID=4108 RepID=A0A0V0H911_SOLCH